MKKIRIIALLVVFLTAPVLMNSCRSSKVQTSKVKSKSSMGNPKDRNNGVWGRGK